MANVLVSGGKGLIGRHLCKKLHDNGHVVSILSRTKSTEGDYRVFAWDIDKKYIENGAIESADHIIHMAGANIAGGRWTEKRKQLILSSRVGTTQLLLDKVWEVKASLKSFVSASAIGYYGAVTSSKIFLESDPAGTDFLGRTCELWEESVGRCEKLGVRSVKIRTGVVLTRTEGALAKMKLPVSMGFGATIGRGDQYLPWIHIDDVCGIFVQAIEDNAMNGAFNAVAPDHKTNDEFTKVLAQVLHKPLWLPNIPASVIRLLYGEMADVLLKGSRVSSDAVIAAGYKFKFDDLKSALVDLIR